MLWKFVNFMPVSLIVVRALLGLIAFGLHFQNAPAFWFGAVIFVAMLSDIFDGIIARKLGVATPQLRFWDSMIDDFFYICIFAVTLIRHFDLLFENGLAILALITIIIWRHGIDNFKFGKSAAYHMWSSKLWGILLFLGFTEILVFAHTHLFFRSAIYWGIIANVEGLAATFMLRKWVPDVPTLFHAFKLRRQFANA